MWLGKIQMINEQLQLCQERSRSHQAYTKVPVLHYSYKTTEETKNKKNVSVS